MNLQPSKRAHRSSSLSFKLKENATGMLLPKRRDGGFGVKGKKTQFANSF
jgi:hypothetical protein